MWVLGIISGSIALSDAEVGKSLLEGETTQNYALCGVHVMLPFIAYVESNNIEQKKLQCHETVQTKPYYVKQRAYRQKSFHVQVEVEGQVGMRKRYTRRKQSTTFP